MTPQPLKGGGRTFRLTTELMERRGREIAEVMEYVANSTGGGLPPARPWQNTATRLARYFGTSGQFWLNLQAAFGLDVTGRKIGSPIQRKVLLRNVV